MSNHRGKKLTMTSAKVYEPQVAAALRSLKSEYQGTTDDAGLLRA